MAEPQHPKPAGDRGQGTTGGTRAARPRARSRDERATPRRAGLGTKPGRALPAGGTRAPGNAGQGRALLRQRTFLSGFPVSPLESLSTSVRSCAGIRESRAAGHRRERQSPTAQGMPVKNCSIIKGRTHLTAYVLSCR